MSDSFRIDPGAPTSRVIVHVPHSSVLIPAWVREHILLSNAKLEEELGFLTDAQTEAIALGAAARAPVKPWLFINQLSRLVVDPERFPDPNQEPMAAPQIGMGPVYLRTAHGELLRDSDTEHEQQLMQTYFHPYSQALSQLVSERLAACGSVVIIDLHSFPKDELPYERWHHADSLRPPLCIGVDEFHTPDSLLDAATSSFTDLGESLVNAPGVAPI